ncbi:uncharacterized protein BDV14DRAFT_105780 [Aspergillus stella-maris]|uniref:uncharacterized protein n=1 Tax=Aspergillus stella-maris TaxID=1810926 RepID=UPI003CCE420F
MTPFYLKNPRPDISVGISDQALANALIQIIFSTTAQNANSLGCFPRYIAHFCFKMLVCVPDLAVCSCWALFMCGECLELGNGQRMSRCGLRSVFRTE